MRIWIGHQYYPWTSRAFHVSPVICHVNKTTLSNLSVRLHICYTSQSQTMMCIQCGMSTSTSSSIKYLLIQFFYIPLLPYYPIHNRSAWAARKTESFATKRYGFPGSIQSSCLPWSVWNARKPSQLQRSHQVCFSGCINSCHVQDCCSLFQEEARS